MTEQGPRDEPTLAPAAPRHRRSAAGSVGAWLGAVRRPQRRELLVGAGALLLVLLLVLGYLFLVLGYTADDDRAADGSRAIPSGSSAATPPTSAGSSVPPPAGPSGTASPPAGPSGTSSPGPGGAAPSGPGDAPAPPSDGDRPTPPAERAEPRLVGPRSFAGFETLLSAYCEERGDRAAVLLDGRNGDPATGDWVCVRVVTFTRINLDEACRDSFGAGAEARRIKQGDSRTWRCFDS